MLNRFVMRNARLVIVACFFSLLLVGCPGEGTKEGNPEGKTPEGTNTSVEDAKKKVEEGAKEAEKKVEEGAEALKKAAGG